ncbi:MAG: hypothetical protein QG552_2228 [Thermodesulfobacteriota bacterium]|nr:hypothetical protein [Thermodesulfobacteriota bacterium]
MAQILLHVKLKFKERFHYHIAQTGNIPVPFLVLKRVLTKPSMRSWIISVTDLRQSRRLIICEPLKAVGLLATSKVARPYLKGSS